MSPREGDLCGRRSLRLAATAASAILLAATAPAATAWQRDQLRGDNTGFVDVMTAPSGAGSRSVPGLGTFAPGAGPVIAADGTVYLGTVQGTLIALRANGSPFWNRQLPGQTILASPAISADGSVYVIGVKRFRDHRNGKTETVSESRLHKFTASGGMLGGGTLFPDHDGHGFTSAPPNILSSGGSEVVLIPVAYRSSNTPTVDVRLIAFSTDAVALDDKRVTLNIQKVTGGSDLGGALGSILACVMTVGYSCWPIKFSIPKAPIDPVTQLPPHTVPPMAGVAVSTFASGGAPRVIVSDQLHDIVGFTYTSAAGLTETFRVRDPARGVASAPMVLPDGRTLVGTADGASGSVLFVSPNGTKLPPVTKLRPVLATPTRTADGAVIVVQTDGSVAVVRDGALVTNGSFSGQSIASAAASRTHVFVSMADAFYTFDATLAVASKVDWVGGGISPPAIGPQGHVYAIASNILFVFPPPKLTIQSVQPATRRRPGG